MEKNHNPRILRAADIFTSSVGACIGAAISAVLFVGTFFDSIKDFEMDKPTEYSRLIWSIILLAIPVSAIISHWIGTLLKSKIASKTIKN